jgi:hypothetical protein
MMAQLCIEDGFEYNIKRAVDRFLADFNGDRKAAAEAFAESDHAEAFAIYLLDQAETYMDVAALISGEDEEE